MFRNTTRLWSTEHPLQYHSMCLRRCLSSQLVSTSEVVSPLAPSSAVVAGVEASVGAGTPGMRDGVVVAGEVSPTTTTPISTGLSLTEPPITTTIPTARTIQMAIIPAPTRTTVRTVDITRMVITARTAVVIATFPAPIRTTSRMEGITACSADSVRLRETEASVCRPAMTKVATIFPGERTNRARI
jgi:hypothetical protein